MKPPSGREASDSIARLKAEGLLDEPVNGAVSRSDTPEADQDGGGPAGTGDADPWDGIRDDEPKGGILPPPSEPLAVARALVGSGALGDTEVRRWRGSFYLWAGAHWTEVADDTVRSHVYHDLEHVAYWRPGKPDKDGNVAMEVVPWSPNRRKVGDVLEALQALTHLDEHTDPPAWIDGEDGGRMLAVSNGLLELVGRELVEHTPRLFNLNALPYAYEAGANEPSRWLAFLAELWPEDAKSIGLLQEWFGYLLSGDTSHQKILLMVGPPRSGKGTIARILSALVGKANTAGPTLASLGTNFGLSPLLGKSLALISDARLGGPNTYAVVERLLSISGEDDLTVDRKYREPWTGKLPTRFTVISNELPNLGDASGAIATRFVVLTLATSWLGRENPRLTSELLAELPGILNWALDGLDRLQAQGHFTEPETSRDVTVALADLASPVQAFVRERCQVGAHLEVEVDKLYAAWREWCEDQGRDRPGTKQRFGRDLHAVVPAVKTRQHGTGEEKRRWYVGLALDTGTARNGPDRVPTRAPDEDGTQARIDPPGGTSLTWDNTQAHVGTRESALGAVPDEYGTQTRIDLAPEAYGPCARRCGRQAKRYGPDANPLCKDCRSGLASGPTNPLPPHNPQ